MEHILKRMKQLSASMCVKTSFTAPILFNQIGALKYRLADPL
ncbi:hypothetical protein CEV32_1016 [Brucella rhizosphaerae]|uniref:Uncharacterized protein n=1 Tax=Brucella rhizosphaerae TaxID=571254 RepID=A0A256FEH1_9HYPH|nr:hypothetical protein CEV32_1016 [Brucella rhizosphaerae]